MKLSTLILEARDKPKLVIMAGGAGTGTGGRGGG